MEDNDKDDDNNDKELLGELVESGFQGHWPYDDDDNEEDDDEEEDNDKDDDNNKDDNNDKGISVLGLDRDLEFSRGHQEHQGHQPHDDLAQIRVNSRRFA